MSVLYHPGKVYLVVDTLSRITMGSVFHVEESKKVVVKDVHKLARLGVRLEDSPNGGFMVHHISESSLMVDQGVVLTSPQPQKMTRSHDGT